MRLSTSFVAGFSVLATAFPTAENLGKLAKGELGTVEDIEAGLLQLKERRLLFDPLTTPIDVSGEHAFQPPNFDKGDQRGPCPGLNALANHGYLPRNGISSIIQSIDASNKILGMGVDIATVLTMMAVVGAGNPLSTNPSYSLGGKSPEVSNLLGNLLGLMGTPRGLDGTHNWIEVDGSITRDDLYVTGDATSMNMTRWMHLHDATADGKILDMDFIGDWAASRRQESIETNPYMYFGPWIGTVDRSAGFAFAGRLMSNHSAEYPMGSHITRDVLKSFWGVYDEPSKDGSGSSSLVYKEGWEQIPQNWYRISTDYTLAHLSQDVVKWVKKHPELASVGGNMGKVNTFTGVDISDLSGGVLNGKTALQGNNLMCFAMQYVNVWATNSLRPLFKTLEKPLELLSSAITGPLTSLDCPTLDAVDHQANMDRLNKFPGARKSHSFL